MKNIRKFEEKIRIYLSHRPRLYALVVGIGIVLFWRGVWHTTDLVHNYFSSVQGGLTIGSVHPLWWDGPLSFVMGCVVLFFTGAFTSSFIGNELILSGLRGEKRLNQKQEVELKTEMQAISEMKDGLKGLAGQIEQLEKNILEKDKNI